MARGSVQLQIFFLIFLALLCFILGNTGLLSTVTFVATLLYVFLRFNRLGSAFPRSNLELCGEISCF